MRTGKPAVLLILYALLLIGGTGCASYFDKTSDGNPPRQALLPTSELLLGRIEQPSRARAALEAWCKAVDNNDTLWMKGLERRYAYALTRYGLALSLQEKNNAFSNMNSACRTLLLDRLDLQTTKEERAQLTRWKDAYIENEFESAQSIPLKWKTDSSTGKWIKVRAQALALYQMGRFLEAVELLSDTTRFNPVFGRRDDLLRVECNRRSGRLLEARAEWAQLVEKTLTAGDYTLCGPILDTGHALQNLMDKPLDRGRLVALAEQCETLNDTTRAWRAYQEIWSDPRMPNSPEKLAARNSMIRRAGLGTLRIISGKTAEGDPYPRVTRWLDELEHEPNTKGKIICLCELKRFQVFVDKKQGRLAEALMHANEAVELAEESNAPALIAKARGDLAVIQANTGYVEEALQNVRAASQASEASGDRELVHQILQNRLAIESGIKGEDFPELAKKIQVQGRRLGLLSPAAKLN